MRDQRFSLEIFLQRTFERSLTREKRLLGSSFSARSLSRLTASTSWSVMPGRAEEERGRRKGRKENECCVSVSR